MNKKKFLTIHSSVLNPNELQEYGVVSAIAKVLKGTTQDQLPYILTALKDTDPKEMLDVKVVEFDLDELAFKDLCDGLLVLPIVIDTRTNK